MNKSTITREQVVALIAEHSYDSALVDALEHLLAAMDSSESVELPLDYLQGHKDGLEWASQLAEANHPETGDWLYDDPIELAKAIRKGPDVLPAQPAADSEPVAWTWQHLKQWHVTNDEERARDLAWDGVKVEPLYRRAAMLAAAPHDTPALNSVQSVVTVPGKWIPVSERIPEDRTQVILWDAEIGEVTSGHYSHKTHTFYHCGDAIENEITHWMAPPAAPQEVSDA